MSVRTGTSSLRSLAAPPRSGRSMMKQAASTCAPNWRNSLTAPSAVPPSPAGGDTSADGDARLAFPRRVLVHPLLVEAVSQRIGDRPPLVRQLALLADRHEAGRALVRHRPAEDEAARLDAGDLVDL